MGCSPSKSPKKRSRKEVAAEIEDVHLKEIKKPPPKIRIDIGRGAQKYNDGKAIIFIFGGPASMKGSIVDELEAEFGFTMITVADIVLSYLPNKVANTVATVQEIQDLLTTDKSLLTVEWVLHLINARISTSNHQRWIIDVVPNLLSIMTGESYKQHNFEVELANFERRHPVLFALNLVVSSEILGMKTTPGFKMRRRNKQAEEPEPEPKQKPEKSTKDDDSNGSKSNGEVSKFEIGSDEADGTRMQKRNEIYMSCARHFINYFQKDQRTVELHISSKKTAYVCKKAIDFFADFGFQGVDPNRVILFVKDDAAIEGLDTVYYKMLKEEQVQSIRGYIERSASASANHLIILDCLKVTPSDLVGRSNAYRRINFFEERECYLDRYIEIKSTAVVAVPFKRPFKCISSSNENIERELCKRIAYSFSNFEPVEDETSGDSEQTELNENATSHHVQPILELTRRLTIEDLKSEP